MWATLICTSPARPKLSPASPATASSFKTSSVKRSYFTFIDVYRITTLSKSSILYFFLTIVLITDRDPDFRGGLIDFHRGLHNGILAAMEASDRGVSIHCIPHRTRLDLRKNANEHW